LRCAERRPGRAAEDRQERPGAPGGGRRSSSRCATWCGGRSAAPAVLRRHLAGLRDAQRAVVIGSYARGTETAASDVDLLVVGQPDADELTDRIGRAEREIDRPVNYVVITEVEQAERRARGDRFVVSVDAGPTLPVLP